MHVRIDEAVEAELREMAAARGFGDEGAYLRDLILRDWAEHHRDALVARAEHSLESGEAEPVEADWKQRVASRNRQRLGDA